MQKAVNAGANANWIRLFRLDQFCTLNCRWLLRGKHQENAEVWLLKPVSARNVSGKVADSSAGIYYSECQ